jgi:hypothetical protein
VGAGAASAVLGSVFGILALDQHSTLTHNCDSNGSCPATQADYNAIAHQSAYAVTSTVAFAFGIAAAGAGTVLLIVSSGGSSESAAPAHAVTAQPWIGVGSAGMTGSFW